MIHNAYRIIIAELLRAEGARAETHSLENLGNPSSRENLVMRSPYERANAVRTDSGGGCGASQYKPKRGAQQRHFFLPSRDLRKEKVISACYVNIR